MKAFVLMMLAAAVAPQVGLAAAPAKKSEARMATLNHPLLGFSLDYPSEWTLRKLFPSKGANEPIVDFDVSFQSNPKDPDAWVGVWFNVPDYGTPKVPSFSVASQERPEFSFDEFVRELTGVVEKDGAKIVAARKTKVGGKEAYEVVYSVGQDIWQRIITVQYGKKRLVIAQHRTPKAVYEQFDPIIQKVLASVKFE